MGDYGMRGEAAQRLMKKGKKGAPPEDDLGLPPEDGADAPPAEGGAPDLAALLGAGAGGPPPGGMPPDAGMPPQGPEEEAAEGQPQDLDTALGGVENALESFPPEAAEEIRIKLNEIREIAAKAGATPAPQQAPGPEAPEAGMPMPPGPAKEEQPT